MAIRKNMLPLTDEQIRTLSESDLENLANCDAAGLLLRPGDSAESFRERLLALSAQLREIEGELASPQGCQLFDGFTFHSSERIPDEIMRESAETTEKLFRFSANWAPGFFLSKSLGILWGGCTLSFPDTHLSVFIIRANFARAAKWFIYRRDELLSHELCHAARSPMNDHSFEELFAYMSSSSPLRRYLGNCFRQACDAFIFIVPVFVLLIAQLVSTFTPLELPVWLFWIFAALGPAFLLFRNHCDRNTYLRAEAKIKKAGVSEARAFLFRCTESEIREMAALGADPALLCDFLERNAASELRWRVIKHRFISPSTQNDDLMSKLKGKCGACLEVPPMPPPLGIEEMLSGMKRVSFSMDRADSFHTSEAKTGTVSAGQFEGFLQLEPFIDPLRCSEDMGFFIATFIFRASTGSCYKYRACFGFSYLWPSMDTICRPSEEFTAFDLALHTTLDSRESYEVKLNDFSNIKGFLKYVDSSLKVLISQENLDICLRFYSTEVLACRTVAYSVPIKNLFWKKGITLSEEEFDPQGAKYVELTSCDLPQGIDLPPSPIMVQ